MNGTGTMMTTTTETRATRARRADTILATAILLVGGSALGVAAASAEPSAAPAATAVAAAGEHLAGYRAAQVAADRIPKGFPAERHGAGGLDVSTSRLLAKLDGGVTYWSVADRAGNLCLVVDDPVREMTSAGCGDVADLEKGSIALSHTLAGRGGLQAFLVADGFEGVRLADGWSWAGGNLVVAAIDAEPTSAVTLTDGDRRVELTPFTEPE